MDNLNGDDGSIYHFDDVVIDRDKFEVSKSSEPRALTPRVFDVLVYLIRERGRVVEKQELVEQVWKGAFVSDNSLTRAIKEIRRELGDSAVAPRYIETVHKRGYRFIAELEEAVDKTADTETVIKPLESPKPGMVSSPWRESPSHPFGTWITKYKAVAAVVLTAILLATAAAVYFGRGENMIRSIVVLPLENASADANMEYLSDGITESLINSLSELPSLKVIARSTAFRYRGQEFDAQKLRRDLGVDAVLTGRVVQQGEDLIVQADLIDAADGSQIWGARYSRKLSGIFALQGEIATDISKKLRLRLTGEQEKRLTKPGTENAEAYRLYQTGRYFWNKRSEENLRKSIEYFQQAIEKDPNYALAHAGIADSYAVMAISADLPAHEVFPKAKAAAARALDLDNGLVEAHATMLRIKSQYDRDWTGAENEYRKALELNPNYPMTHVYYLSYLLAAGRTEEGIASVRRAHELDPLSLVINAVLARALFFAGRYDEAIAASQKTLELDQNVFLARLILGRSYMKKGMFEEAIGELKKARALSGSVSESSSLLAFTYAVSGQRAEANKVLEEMMVLSNRRYVQPYDIAIVHAGLGDKDQAFEWLEKAYRDRNHQITLINAVPEFESLRSDPRFSSLLQRAAERVELARQVGEVKRRQKLSTVDYAQERVVFKRARSVAKESDLLRPSGI